MKVFFDTNVYVAEALLGRGAERLIEAVEKASWRIFTSSYVLDELERVMIEYFDSTRRFATLTRKRARRRATLVRDGSSSRHIVPDDPKDNPVLQAALKAKVDYLVTNDSHLLDLSPYEGMRIASMSDCIQLLADRGLLG